MLFIKIVWYTHYSMNFLRSLFAVFFIAFQFFSVGIAFANTSGYAQFLDVDLDANSVNDRINFGPFTSSTAVVTVSDTAVTGFAFGESVGWINFGPFTSSTGGVVNTCDPDGNGLLSGYAFGENAGWINFGPFTSSSAPTVKIDVADGGKFTGTTSGTGYAWSENYGWIQFSCSDPDSCVTTTWPGCTIDVCPNLSGEQSSVPSGYTLIGGQCIKDECTDCDTGSIPALCVLVPTKTVLRPGETTTINWATNITNGEYVSGIFQGNIFNPNTSSQSFTVGPITGNVTYTAAFSGNFRSGFAYCSTTITYEGESPLMCTNFPETSQVAWRALSTPETQYYVDGNGNCLTRERTQLCSNRMITQSSWLSQSSNNYIDDNGNCLTDSFDDEFCSNIPGVTLTSWLNQDSLNRVQESDNYCYKNTDNESFCSNIPGVSFEEWYNEDPELHYVNYTTGVCAQFAPEKVCYNLNPDGLDEVPEGYIGIGASNRTCIPDTVGVGSLFNNGGWGWIPQAIALLGLLGSIPGFAIRILNLILALPFYRRKRPWGVVYDSESKETLDPVYVSVYNADTNELVETRITDINGRYGFLLPKGNYYMTAQKTHYEFPSQKLPRQNSDGVYDNLYFGEPFSITDDSQGTVVTLNIPMDRLAEDWNQEEKRRRGILRMITNNTKFWSTISLVLFILGFVFSAFVLTIDQSTWNVFVFILYVIFTILQLIGFGPVHSGVVTDKQGNPIPFAVVRVWNAHLGNEIAKRITNEYGQYYILIARGDYYVTIDVKNPTTGNYDRIFTSTTIRAVQGMINENFKNI